MQILYAVHQFFPNHYTGTERLVLNLCKQMQRVGHHVTVLTYGITDVDDFTDAGLFFIKKYQYQGIPIISIRHKKNTDLVSFTIFDNDMVIFLDNLLSEEKFDIIHVCHPMRVGSIIRSAENKNIPVILTLTDFWLMCPFGIALTQSGTLCNGSGDGLKCLHECYPGPHWTESIQNRFHQAQEVFFYVRATVSATHFLKMMFEHQGFYRNIKIIPFGKDYRAIKKNIKSYEKNSNVTIGYLSSLNPHKGAHLLLESYQIVNPPNICLKIFGDPSFDLTYFDKLKKIARGNPKIEFCGKYSYEDMPQILENLDIVAVPSIWWENSPLVLLRSLAHNVPAIVSNLGGLTEIVKEGENGFIFSVTDSDSKNKNTRTLSDIIQLISDNPLILNDVKTRIRSPPHIEEEAFAYENLYRQVLLKFTFNNVETSDQNSQKKYGKNFVFDIHENDAMYQFLKNHPGIEDPLNEYYSSGESMVKILNEIFSDQKIDAKSISSFLDFAAGYGRFTRFLPFLFPMGTITVSDIDKNAVNFCKEKIQVNGFYSSEDPKDLEIQNQFDVIWVASLFSHLSLHSWEAWIKKLYEMLNDNGIIIFSTHGCHCINMLDGITKQNIIHLDHGFYFLKQSEINTLSTDIYGTAYVTEEFVTRFIEKNTLGRIVGYYPKKLWDFQDIYVIRKQN